MAILKFGCVSLLLFLGFSEAGWCDDSQGDVIAHWSGKDNMFEMENYRKFFHGEVNGILEERTPLQESQGLFNWGQIRCQVSMNIYPKTKARDSFGTCTIPLQNTHEIIHFR
ncbi:MAG: hypothetical protein KC592_15755 [Nitrospira sp.]|nr:hypothetical protein [Nitrospira sp.]MCW5782577.1 hypothetical protein [Nitrospirales bacterium]